MCCLFVRADMFVCVCVCVCVHTFLSMHVCCSCLYVWSGSRPCHSSSLTFSKLWNLISSLGCLFCTILHLCQIRPWGSWTAAEAPPTGMSSDCEPDRKTDRRWRINQSLNPLWLTSPLTLYLFTTMDGDWGISRRLWLIGSDCRESSITPEIGNICSYTSVCTCVCGDGGDGIAAPAGEMFEFRVVRSLVSELNDSRDNEKDWKCKTNQKEEIGGMMNNWHQVPWGGWRSVIEGWLSDSFVDRQTASFALTAQLSYLQ